MISCATAVSYQSHPANMYSFASLAFKGFPSGYSKSVCVCVRLHSENSAPTMLISRTTPDGTPPDAAALPIASSQTLSPSSPSFSSFGTASVMCCFTPACSTPLRPSVHHPRVSISLVVNIMNIQIFCEHLYIYFIFSTRQTCIVLKSGWTSYAANARVLVSPPSMSPSDPPTPSSRWPAPTTLPPLAKFQLV